MLNQIQLPSEEESHTGRRVFRVFMLFFVVVLIFSFFFLVGSLFNEKEESHTETHKALCGDGVCDPGENCYDCSADCRCGAREYCSKETKTCTKA